MKFSIVQSALARQMRKRKFSSSSRPRRRVDDLGMELDRVAPPLAVGERRDRRVLAVREDLPPLRHLLEAIAVAHPHRRLVADAEPWKRSPSSSTISSAGPNSRASRARRARPILLGEHAHAVADAEQRHAQLGDARIRQRRIRLVHARRPARENDPLRPHRANLVERQVERMQLAVDVRLAHPPRDQLGVLASRSRG